jgi:ligand-binding SRPBCC domain-containing protein
MGEINETTTIKAPLQAVWDLISVQANWSVWTPARQVVLDPPGAPDPNGVGAVRVMRVAGPIAVREEIVAYDPPTAMSYRLRSSFPVRNYLAHMRLEDSDGETVLTWSATWDDRVGFVSGLLLRYMTRTVRKMSAGIKAESERHSADDG